MATAYNVRIYVMNACFVCQRDIAVSGFVKLEADKLVCVSCSELIVATHIAKHMAPQKLCKVCGGDKHRTGFQCDINVCNDCCRRLGEQFDRRFQNPCTYCKGEGQLSISAARTGVTNTFVCPRCLGSGHNV